MKQTIVCPECGNLAHYNSLFHSYFCTRCSWVDSSPRDRRTIRRAFFNKFLAGEPITKAELKEVLRTCT